MSPQKTVEGTIAGVVAAVGVAAGAALVQAQPLPRLAGLGLVVGAGAVLGDLVESAIKRRLGAKESGWIMPGHGGILDRVDSLLFSGFLGYLYLLASGQVA